MQSGSASAFEIQGANDIPDLSKLKEVAQRAAERLAHEMRETIKRAERINPATGPKDRDPGITIDMPNVYHATAGAAKGASEAAHRKAEQKSAHKSEDDHFTRTEIHDGRQELKKGSTSTIERKSDGSEIERDNKTGKPLSVVDANQNHFKYTWSADGKDLQDVVMCGPATNNKVWHFKEKNILEIGGDILARVGGSAAFMDTMTKYDFSVSGTEKPANGQVGVGIALPAKDGANLKVDANGTLTIFHPSMALNHTITGRATEQEFHTDGTSTIRERSYIGDHVTQLRKDGQPIP